MSLVLIVGISATLTDDLTHYTRKEMLPLEKLSNSYDYGKNNGRSMSI